MPTMMTLLALQAFGVFCVFTPNLASAAIPPSDLTCSNGVRGVEDQGSCCVAECGTCGGSGCPQAGAKPSQFFGASDCCSTTIQDEGDLCDVTGVAPCIVYKLESTGRENAPTSIEVPATVGNGTRGGSTCSNGFPGVEKGGACCPLECDKCRGLDCGTAGGGAECCMSTIIKSGVSCSESGAAPCVIDDKSLAPSASVDHTTSRAWVRGTPSFRPLSPFLSFARRGLYSAIPSLAGLGGGRHSSSSTGTDTCNNGIPGIQNAQACCVLECGQCGGHGCTTAGGLGQVYCCSDIVLNSGIYCSVSGAAPCIVEESSWTGSFTSGGEPATSYAVEPLISATTCDTLKYSIEAGESGRYELANDVICGETITVVEGQDVILTSTSDAPRSKYSIAPASPFMGGTSPTTSTVSDGGAGGDFSMLVVENGGSLIAVNVIFESSSLAVDGTMTAMASIMNGNQSTVTTSEGSGSAGDGGVRAIFSAGNITIDDCEFAGSGNGATALVMNGGAIYMSDVDDLPNGPSFVSCFDSTFHDYSTGGSGGAIFAEGSGSLDISGSTFVGNSAGLYSDTEGDGDTGSGGAIYAGPDVSLSVTDSTFEGNAAIDGGAIACYGGTLSGVTVSGSNTSEAGFGAVLSSDPSKGSNDRGLKISGSSFEENNGGSMATFNTDVNITSSAFTDNDGALYFETSDPERDYYLQMTGVDFEGNGPSPDAWGVVAEGEASLAQYIVIKETVDGPATSMVELTSVTCMEESMCAMTVDDSAFDVTGDTDCSVCNESGEVIAVLPANEGRAGDESILEKYFGLIIGLVVLALLTCCLCLYCCVVVQRRKKQKESEIPVIVDRV